MTAAASAGVSFLTPSTEQAAQIAGLAHDAESYVLGPVSDSLSSFYAYVRSLYSHPAPAVQAVVNADSFPREDIGGVMKQLAQLAKVVDGLNRGVYELVPWTRRNADGSLGAPVIGVVAKGSALGFWPYVAAIVVVAAATGAFIIADLYMQARAAEARAHETIAAADARMQTAIAASKSTEERAQLIQAMQTAHQAAATPEAGFLSNAGSNLASLASGLSSGAGGLFKLFTENTWPWVIVVAYMLYTRRRKGAVA